MWKATSFIKQSSFDACWPTSHLAVLKISLPFISLKTISKLNIQMRLSKVHNCTSVCIASNHYVQCPIVPICIPDCSCIYKWIKSCSRPSLMCIMLSANERRTLQSVVVPQTSWCRRGNYDLDIAWKLLNTIICGSGKCQEANFLPRQWSLGDSVLWFVSVGGAGYIPSG